MDTLFIFDDSGFIYYQASGSVREPEGMTGNKKMVSVPQGKKVDYFDMSGAEPEPVFEDLPKTEVQLLQEQVNNLNIAMAAVIGGSY